ncbi:MAG: sugar transferase [Clostridia bacterium]|nr:sugar transferase [Clostridia bacterium]
MVKWESLPKELKNDAVRGYYDALRKRGLSLFLKRCFDIFASSVLIILLSPVMLILAVWIKLDSKGPVFYKSERVTRYNQPFKILKFRTMVTNADKMGTLVTVAGDSRITKVGAKIRKARLDEFPQLFNVFLGQMSFVGTRPEVRKYVDAYTEEMMATLLLPAGITSVASLKYRDEDDKLKALTDKGMSVDEAYIEHILPDKMKYNLEYTKTAGLLTDIKICIKTVI